MRKHVLVLSLALLSTSSAFLSCSSSYTPPSQKFSVLDGSPGQESNHILGSGTLLANNPLRESEQHFGLEIELPRLNSSATLFAFGAEKLKLAAWIRFTRLEKSIAVTLGGPDNEAGIDISAAFQAIAPGADPSQSLAFSLGMDFHNEETEGTHVVIWTQEACPATESSCDATKALFENHAPGKGRGKFWGISVQDASVRYQDPSSAKAKE